jgi:hypothetical protein
MSGIDPEHSSCLAISNTFFVSRSPIPKSFIILSNLKEVCVSELVTYVKQLDIMLYCKHVKVNEIYIQFFLKIV